MPGEPGNKVVNTREDKEGGEGMLSEISKIKIILVEYNLDKRSVFFCSTPSLSACHHVLFIYIQSNTVLFVIL